LPVFLLTIKCVMAQIINIPADYPAIHQGIDAASKGDTVWVAPGTPDISSLNLPVWDLMGN